MARALAGGLVRAGLLSGQHLLASDPDEAARTRFAQEHGAATTPSNVEVAQRSDVLVLSVKPQAAAEVLDELAPHVTERHLVVSIVAGLATPRLDAALRSAPRLVRVMPNTPCLIGEGASAYCLGPRATAADGQLVDRLLRSVGLAVPVSESLFDAVTGLSGSGPAFAYVMIEALSDGGVQMGLPRDVAIALAAQTVAGAAAMVRHSGEHPAVLRDRVASPGGTTIAGLRALEDGGFRAALMAAVEAATRRCRELGNSTPSS
jgi:pyrroline-5-carboxylate reductase